MKHRKRKGIIRRSLSFLVAVALLAGLACLGVSCYVRFSVASRVITAQAAAEGDYDCILVLGAAIWEHNTPCPMLADRLDWAIDLYQNGASSRLLMSGDHSTVTNDETTVMKRYAIAAGVPSEAVFMDHAGYSTYESVWRAKYAFGAKRIVIVTQGYHLYRALYIAQKLGLEADGVASDTRTYAGQAFRVAREVLARDKDFVKCLPGYETLPPDHTWSLTASGDVTNDGQYNDAQ